MQEDVRRKRTKALGRELEDNIPSSMAIWRNEPFPSFTQKQLCSYVQPKLPGRSSLWKKIMTIRSHWSTLSVTFCGLGLLFSGVTVTHRDLHLWSLLMVRLLDTVCVKLVGVDCASMWLPFYIICETQDSDWQFHAIYSLHIKASDMAQERKEV